MDLDEPVNCAACGYDLTGVGWEGHCPECGRFYDKASGRGVARGAGVLSPVERGDRVIMLAKLGAYGALALGCLVWGGIASLSSPMPARPLILGMIGGGAFGFAVYATWFIDRRDGP